jgi:RNA polymerase sigma factor (sigma-70 family)
MFAKFYEDAPEQGGRNLTRPAELDDQTLWQRFKNGNDLAFSIIYKKYIQRLYNYGMHSCYDRDLVMDCLQELFARLWDKRLHLADVEAVSAYLFKSFRRLLLTKLTEKRKQSLHTLNASDEGFQLLTSVEDAIILEEASAAQVEHLRKAIESLTKRQREVIFLKFYNELSYQQVATVMEMETDSVYNLVSKAVDALRKTLKPAYMLILAVISGLFFS